MSELRQGPPGGPPEGPDEIKDPRGIIRMCLGILEPLRSKLELSEVETKALELFSAVQGLVLAEFLSSTRNPAPYRVIYDLIARNEEGLSLPARQVANRIKSALERFEARMSQAPGTQKAEGSPWQPRILNDEDIRVFKGDGLQVWRSLRTAMSKSQKSLADISKETRIPFPKIYKAFTSTSFRDPKTGTPLDHPLSVGELTLVGMVCGVPIRTDALPPVRERVRRLLLPERAEITPYEDIADVPLKEIPPERLSVVSLAQVKRDREAISQFMSEVTRLRSAVKNIQKGWEKEAGSEEHIRDFLFNVGSLTKNMQGLARGQLDGKNMRTLVELYIQHVVFAVMNIVGLYHVELRTKLNPIALRLSKITTPAIIRALLGSDSDRSLTHEDLIKVLGHVVALMNVLERELTAALASGIKTNYGHVRVAARHLVEMTQALRNILPEGEISQQKGD
ncbi:MAG: hypothetical protein G01um10148_266 [Parcubacteria group bacterium Gr01-1014_8]|nr:MAG: hypothetical protein G01um10148_266 [Parcubacteria group bacterium Gr01-1014_8]